MTYKERKHLRELLRGARKLQRANCDVLAPKQNELLVQAIDELGVALQMGKTGPVAKSAGQLEKQLEKAFPPRKHQWLRENVEVLLVAVVVAMAVRTYFLQPFKIPTGSMQPTLYGVHSPSAENPPGKNLQNSPVPPVNFQIG